MNGTRNNETKRTPETAYTRITLANGRPAYVRTSSMNRLTPLRFRVNAK